MSEKKSKTRLRKKKLKKEEFDIPDSDDIFAFIAGYTSGGVPFGLTHREMAELEKENSQDEIMLYHYMFQISPTDNLKFSMV